MERWTIEGPGTCHPSIYLHWFISEQVEEEASVGEIVDKLRLIANNPSGLFLLDQEMGKRDFTIEED